MFFIIMKRPKDKNRLPIKLTILRLNLAIFFIPPNITIPITIPIMEMVIKGFRKLMVLVTFTMVLVWMVKKPPI